MCMTDKGNELLQTFFLDFTTKDESVTIYNRIAFF